MKKLTRLQLITKLPQLRFIQKVIFSFLYKYQYSYSILKLVKILGFSHRSTTANINKLIELGLVVKDGKKFKFVKLPDGYVYAQDGRPSYINVECPFTITECTYWVIVALNKHNRVPTKRGMAAILKCSPNSIKSAVKSLIKSERINSVLMPTQQNRPKIETPKPVYQHVPAKIEVTPAPAPATTDYKDQFNLVSETVAAHYNKVAKQADEANDKRGAWEDKESPWLPTNGSIRQLWKEILPYASDYINDLIEEINKRIYNQQHRQIYHVFVNMLSAVKKGHLAKSNKFRYVITCFEGLKHD